MGLRKLLREIISKWRMVFIFLVPASLLVLLISLLSQVTVIADDGRADLSGMDLRRDELVSLSGWWEFYWDRCLAPEDFASDAMPQMDSFMKVPGVWASNEGTDYSRQGVATYRLTLTYPPTIPDPALRIQNVANSYKLYVNGKLTAEVGDALENRTEIKNDDEILLVALPRETQTVDLVFQVANLDFATGGLRVAPVFGSMHVLEQQRMLILILQVFFIGGVFIFGLHYIFIYLLQPKNMTALFFTVFCLVSALRSLVWGETPLTAVFPQASLNLRMYLNYLTGYNFVALVILFVRSIYPSEYKKSITAIVLLPSVVLSGLLLILGPAIMTFLTNTLYIFLLLQMLYLMIVQIKAVLRRRDNAFLMFVTVCVLIWAMNVDILNFVVVGNIYLSCTFLFGNFAFILAMSYVQARQQASNYKNLILYNEKLLEADRLKDQIMATEMSFLQAQIKPHFLYNALSAIANVCEKDGSKAGKLIIDLALYLRGSLEFNNLDRLTTIEKELTFVDTYFHIEQARFGQKIQLRKEIDSPLDVHIPVLILQPLVENAVRHGISKKQGGGAVTVRMAQSDGGIHIEIEDDGVGIDAVRLEALLIGGDTSKGVGLLNIHHRLLKLYGSGLEITSGEGRTRVSLWIPEAV